MKWYDYAWIAPFAIIIAVASTPFAWLETISDILISSKDYYERRRDERTIR